MTSSARQLLCVTTNKPAFAMAGGGGALTLVCPYTGSLSSSLAVSGDLSSTSSNAVNANQQLGMSSLSLFPPALSNALHPSRTPLALAFGGKGGSTKDCAAMLVSLNASNPKAHWKARLPEPSLPAGMVVTPCGHYALGGGASGTLYVWSTLHGRLLRSLPKAHYRSVTCLCLSQDQRHVLTGGADGMVHLFALADLVSADIPATSGNAGSKSVNPIRTWPQHNVPITALAALTQDRMVSASQDGVLHVLETFSEAIVAKIQFPQGVQSLAVLDQQVWVGGSMGMIYCLNLDQYALHQTLQLGAKIADNGAAEVHRDESGPSYRTTLKGHLYPVTSMVLWSDDQRQDYLASGDEGGTVRIWDLEARVCVQVVRPWSSTAEVASKKKKDGDKKKAAVTQHAVSSLSILQVPEHSVAGQATSGKTKGAWVKNLPPLQKYATSLDHEAQGTAAVRWTPVPLWNCSTDADFWDVTKENYNLRKRSRSATDTEASDELKRLRQQLEEANATIARMAKSQQ